MNKDKMWHKGWSCWAHITDAFYAFAEVPDTKSASPVSYLIQKDMCRLV